MTFVVEPRIEQLTAMREVIVDREFVSWVEPIALRDRLARQELLEFARSVPGDAWLREMPFEDWTCKDLLAHLAGDTGKWFSYILRTVLDDDPFDSKRVGPGADVDALNRRDVEERRGRSVADLIAEIEADGEEHRQLLSALTENHRFILLAPYCCSLVEFFSDNPAGSRGGHDSEHLSQLRRALE